MLQPSSSVDARSGRVYCSVDEFRCVSVVVQGGRTVPLTQTRAGGILITRSASMINIIIYQVMSVMSLSW